MNQKKIIELVKKQQQSDRVVTAIKGTSESRKGKVYALDGDSYEIIVVSNSGEDIDMNVSDKYGTGKPTYTLITGVSSSTPVAIGEMVTVNFPTSLSAAKSQLLPTDGAFDLLTVSVSDAYIVSGGGGGSGCSRNIFEWGVLFD